MNQTIKKKGQINGTVEMGTDLNFFLMTLEKHF